MLTTDTAADLKVWVGCLACYNDGRLMGAWYDAPDAGELTSESVHAENDPGRRDLKDQREGYGQHEELWVMDLEGFGPFSHEMSPCEAGRIANAIAESDVEPAVIFAYAECFGAHYVDWDDLGAIADALLGHASSVEEFTEDWYEETTHRDERGSLWDYVDWESVWQSKFSSECYVTPAEDGGVYVFSA